MVVVLVLVFVVVFVVVVFVVVVFVLVVCSGCFFFCSSSCKPRIASFFRLTIPPIAQSASDVLEKRMNPHPFEIPEWWSTRILERTMSP